MRTRQHAAVAFSRRRPVLHALITMSEREELSADRRARALASRQRFIERAHLGYVIVDEAKTSPALRDFAVELFRLQHVQSAEGYTLYVPGVPASEEIGADEAAQSVSGASAPRSDQRSGQAERHPGHS